MTPETTMGRRGLSHLSGPGHLNRSTSIGDIRVTTVVDRPPEAPAPQPVTDYWMAGLKFHATGRTSGLLREMAADETLTRGLALLSGVTPERERAEMLHIARAIDELAAAGVTPEQAYGLAGLPELFGCPFSEFDEDTVLAERAEPWQTPGYCSGCYQNHPGACGCECHLPVAARYPGGEAA